MFHYSFSAPLQAVTEIMKNKDAAVLVLAAWRWALGGQGSGHGPALCHPPGAVLGTQSRQEELSRPQIGVSAQPETACLSLWAAGLQQSGVQAILPFPASAEAARTVTDSSLQSPPEPSTAPQGQMWEWFAWPKDYQGSSPSVATPIWAHLPSWGCSPQCHSQLWQGSADGDGQRRAHSQASPTPLVHHMERRVQPKMPIWVQKHNAQPPCRWCHLMVQKQNPLPRNGSPGLPALHSSLPYCSFYCN